MHNKVINIVSFVYVTENRIINEVSVNITPVQYLKNYRIEKACFMLLNTKETIINISYACGSGSSSYFGMKI
ncbi:hypothetical protein ACTNDG_07165 [Clostridium sp. HCP1S3_B4]|uniref:hypothetical protein n=1 Tax=unclassified Clostridium TaxID=2614128 RepID=UPI003F8B2CA6